MRLRTGYSFRNVFGPLAEVMDKVETDFAPITDRASTFGFVNWTKLCEERGKKPIYGLEVSVSPEITAKKVTRSPFTFIATESITWLHKIMAQASEQFRYEPLLDYHWLGVIPHHIAIIPGRNALLHLLDPDRPNLYIPDGPGTPASHYEWADKHGVPLIATGDNYYVDSDDRAVYEVLAGFNASSQSFPMHILTEAELRRHCRPSSILARDELAARCSATLQPGELLRPEHQLSLREMCLEGAKRLGCDLSRPEYAERLDKELELITTKQFEDYFFIVADLVEESKKMMCVGPARGSSCGSLVCYLLGITTIDPIPFDLIFERFIDINRSDLPDIDIDFSDQRRQMAFAYLADKYGANRVARLGTVALYKPKSAINETAAALGIPKWKTEAFTGSIIERSSGDARAMFGIADAFEQQTGQNLLREFPELELAARLEGHPRHYSQHAAGMVVTEKPIEEHVAVDARTGAVHCDKHDAEELNLLKLDLLGLTQLSIFEDCLELIGKPKQWDFLYNYPLDDEAAFDVLNRKAWSGIFQFMGDALQSITQSVKITEIEDIIAITALARPGPLASGGTAQWIERKNGREEVTVPHPAFGDILDNSLGIVVYQEQVMRIVREIGGFSWEDTSTIRKVMSKTLGKEYFDRWGAKFVAGAMEKGLTEEEAQGIWDGLCQYGSWAFNRSHSVAYGFISYWCCVLKAHHPLAFAAATLSHTKEPDKQLKLLREMAAEGYEYVPVDPVHSGRKWTYANGKLIGPLSNVIGLGPKMMEECMEARASNQPLPKRAQKLLANPVTPIDELYPVTKRTQELCPEGLKAVNVLTEPTPIIDVQTDTMAKRVVVVVARINDINPRNLNEPQLVQKRGGREIEHNADFLNLILEDDTDQIRATVWGRLWDKVATEIIDRGGAGNVLYVVKGVVGDDFRAIDVDRVKYLGTMK